MLELAVTLGAFFGFLSFIAWCVEAWDRLCMAVESIEDDDLTADELAAIERLYLVDRFEDYASKQAEDV